jgi:hypothetical protein
MALAASKLQANHTRLVILSSWSTQSNANGL